MPVAKSVGRRLRRTKELRKMKKEIKNSSLGNQTKPLNEKSIYLNSWEEVFRSNGDYSKDTKFTKTKDVKNKINRVKERLKEEMEPLFDMLGYMSVDKVVEHNHNLEKAKKIRFLWDGKFIDKIFQEEIGEFK